MPGSAGTVAVVLVEFVEGVGQAKGRKDESVRGEVLNAGVVIGAGLVAEKTGGVGVVAEVEAGLDEKIAADPIEGLLHVEEAFVGIAALAEARRIADGEAVA